jgi:hypothetical protein
MRKSTIAVLLSAFVLPGAGHLYLKHFPRGIALVAASLVCLGFIIDSAMRQASAVLDQLDLEGGALDAGHVADLVAQTSSGSGSSIATLVLAGCWLFGIFDAYRLSYKS